MKKDKLVSRAKFVELSRTTKDILKYYEKIKLLPPAARNERNNYPCYSIRQLSIVNMIRSLKKMGLSLDRIKELQEKRTPENVYALLMEQITDIDKKINEWTDSRKLLYTLQRAIYSGLIANKNDIAIQELPAEKIILGEQNNCESGQDSYDVLLDFYNTATDRHPKLDLNYPVWAVFTQEQIKQKHWHLPDRYYFYNPEGEEERPMGTYAVGYTHGGYGDTDTLYERMSEYIDKSGYEICGNTYEEYPLNEICVSDDKRYLIRIMTQVREK